MLRLMLSTGCWPLRDEVDEADEADETDETDDASSSSSSSYSSSQTSFANGGVDGTDKEDDDEKALATAADASAPLVDASVSMKPIECSCCSSLAYLVARSRIRARRESITSRTRSTLPS
mgnify:CR=1 FL=1